ncbi:MAG: hypothetical protein HYX91_03770 [Chloroflexi bacterium]|nr:hypothetical protein [Chloroflexota bacterium]
MRTGIRGYRLFIAFVFLALVALVAVAGCQDFNQFPQQPAPVEPKPQPERSVSISTADRAILVVYRHLLDRAKSPEAKVYLADFYTVADNWSAESRLLRDGTATWRVLADQAGQEPWQWRKHWRQASWLVLPGGDVIPSTEFEANAIRIEADLQELSNGAGE